MGVYMGVFNLFIVLPQIVMSLIVPQIYDNILGKDPLNVVLFGGFVMLLAAISVFLIKDVGAGAIDTTVPSASAVAGLE